MGNINKLDKGDETAFFDKIEKELFTAVICDVLDDLGYRNQNLSGQIRPVIQNSSLAGRARTILAADVYTMPDVPYEMEIEAVDSVTKNEIIVAATNHSTTNAIWGELLATYTMLKGARGAIIDGCSRDIRKITEMGFRLFTAGINPLDSKGRCLVIDYNCEIICGGVKVRPNDMVFADIDGIVVIPREVENEVIERSLKKVGMENQFLKDLHKGYSLKEAFKRNGIL